MAKGFFTQGVTLLTNGQTTLDDVRSNLRQQGFEIAKESRAREDWEFGGPTLIVPYLPQVNGYLAVDVVNHPWPDAMGDPKSAPTTFGAWSMGYFGPLTYQGGLARARQHAWSWPGDRSIFEGQHGFLRILISYVFGAKGDALIFSPADYNPVAEMMFLSHAVLALLKAPGVVCYFNPNGEVLRDGSSFREVWEPCTQQEKLPLSLWMNIRFFKLNESLGLMDTVGNGQLDVRDIEAIFPMNMYEPAYIDYYLRNVTHYLLDVVSEMKTGDDIDGPDETNLSWTMEILDEGAIEPPRHVVRLYPKAISEDVRAALSAVGRSEALWRSNRDPK